MNPVLVALLGVLLLPLFVATWRASLVGLAGQGMLMAWIASQLHQPAAEHELVDASAWLTLFDLAVVRGVLAPAALYLVLRSRRQAARNDVIPANLLSWTLALGMVLVAYTVSEALVPSPGQPQTLVFVAASGLLLGLLVLATQSSPLSQMIGLLRIENAIALFELGGDLHLPLALQLAQAVVVVVTIALFRWYLQTLGEAETAAVPEGPTL